MSGKYQFTLSTHLPNGDHMESRIWLRPEPYDRKMEEFDIEWFKKEIQKRIEDQCREIMKQEAPVAQPRQKHRT